MTIYNLTTPISKEEIAKLKINDVIFLTGTIVTARDEAHKRALEFYKNGKKLPLDLEGFAVYHCGPLVKRENDGWSIIAAGPTTSTRMDIYEDEFIKNFGVRVVIGKGGMGKRTTLGMQKHGSVYGAFTGGVAVLAARAIKKVVRVEWLDLGMPEALWVLKVKNFGPLIVAIDSYGNNLFLDVGRKAEKNRNRIYQKLGVST
jgi:fumarate hydratase subunit beta